MEEYDYLEELDRVPVLRRRRRNHASFMDILSNEEFFSTTRFTKEGAQQLTAMLEEHLDYEDPRGLTPLNQVDSLKFKTSDKTTLGCITTFKGKLSFPIKKCVVSIF